MSAACECPICAMRARIRELETQLREAEGRARTAAAREDAANIYARQQDAELAQVRRAHLHELAERQKAEREREAAQRSAESAVQALGAMRDELVSAGYPGGDREVALANLRQLVKDRDEARERLRLVSCQADRAALGEKPPGPTNRPTETELATMSWFDLLTEARRARVAETEALDRLAHASQELHKRVWVQYRTLRSGVQGVQVVRGAEVVVAAAQPNWVAVAHCLALGFCGAEFSQRVEAKLRAQQPDSLYYTREQIAEAALAVAIEDAKEGWDPTIADRRALADIRHAITKAEEAVARSRMPGWTPRTVGEACGHHLSELRGLREVERRIIGDPNFHAGPHPAAPGACARCDVLESASAPAPTEPRCAGCQRSIDPATCWCGSPVDGHGYGDGHSAVPMGCECHRRGPPERGTP